MCCPLLLIMFFGPRCTLFYFWLTGYLGSAFETTLWPLLGFFFLPITTLAYTIAMHNGGLTIFWDLVIILAVMLDLGTLGGSERQRRFKRRTVIKTTTATDPSEE